MPGVAHVRRSPLKWKVSDGEVVVKAVHEAVKNPITRPLIPLNLKENQEASKLKK